MKTEVTRPYEERTPGVPDQWDGREGNVNYIKYTLRNTGCLQPLLSEGSHAIRLVQGRYLAEA